MATNTDTTERPLYGKKDGIANAARRYELVLEAMNAPIQRVGAAPKVMKHLKAAPDRSDTKVLISPDVLDQGGRVFNPLTHDRQAMAEAIIVAHNGGMHSGWSFNPSRINAGIRRAAMVDRHAAPDAVGPAIQGMMFGDPKNPTHVKKQNIVGAIAAAANKLIDQKTLQEAKDDLIQKAAAYDHEHGTSFLREIKSLLAATQDDFRVDARVSRSGSELLRKQWVIDPDPTNPGGNGPGNGGGDGEDDGDNGGNGDGDEGGAGPGGTGAGEGEGEGDPNQDDYQPEEDAQDFASQLDAIRAQVEAENRREDDAVYRETFAKRTSHHLHGFKDPDSDSLRIAGQLRRSLELARWPEPTTTVRPADVPPGKLITRAALQHDARAAAGDPAAPTKLFERRSRRTDLPTDLSVGLAIDCSGSMDYLATACARWAYAFSQGAYRAGARFAATTWGDNVYPLCDAGAVLRQQPILACPDGTTALAPALQACIGALDMTRPGRARILVAATDGQLVPNGASDMAALTRRAHRFGIRTIQIYAGRSGNCQHLEGWELISSTEAENVVSRLDAVLARMSRTDVQGATR